MAFYVACFRIGLQVFNVPLSRWLSRSVLMVGVAVHSFLSWHAPCDPTESEGGP